MAFLKTGDGGSGGGSSLSVGTICSNGITATEDTGTLFYGAKFSDYTMLGFSITTASETVNRGSNIVPVSFFNSPGRVVHVQFAVAGSQYVAVLTNVSDTQFKHKLDTALAGVDFKIYGIK